MNLNKNILADIKNTLAPLGVEKIILFGSYASGNAGPESDIDLLILKRLKEDEIRNFRLAYKKALWNKLSKYNIPFDLLVEDENRMHERIKMGDLFYKEILSNGKVIYA
jgi:predicted nucleotidyltransferase